jgi:formyltetrahydrofolate-dependent phosphoribosylglycinamide formyltransferase
MAMRLGVLISGSGTTLQNLIDYHRQGKLKADIVTVISSRAGVSGLEKASQAGLPSIVIARQGKKLDFFAQAIYHHLRDHQVDLVCLAGFLDFLPIPEDFTHRVINIHPSLIPAFSGKGYYGKHVHEAALKAGVKVSGCTVHFADNEFDHGPIISQTTVPVLDTDTAETLAQRVFQAECQAFPDAINLLAENRIQVKNHRVYTLSK